MTIEAIPSAAAVPRPGAEPPQFSELIRRVKEAGLLEKQPGFFAYKILTTLALLAPGIVVLGWTDHPAVQLLNAVYLAFVFTQIIFIAHDAAHRQIFRKAAHNDYLALAVMPLVGVSFSWWFNSHNKHHSSTHEMHNDPAANFPTFAFSQQQAEAKTGFLRRLVKYQAFYFIPASMLYPLQLRRNSIHHLLHEESKYPTLEPILFAVHFPLYFGTLFYLLPAGTAVLFIVVHQGLFSLFMISAFAPNHKGVDILPEDHDLDYMHQQILVSQNVQDHPFADFWYGGLNHHIEHHLFPNMPRNRLSDARKIVRSFCQEHSIPYRETRAPRFYWDLLRFLHRTSAPLRRREPEAAVPPPATARSSPAARCRVDAR